jgi:hypothetical protein
MITKKEFVERIKKLPKTIPSKTKQASYTAFKLQNDILSFHRVNPKTDWELNISELYDIYCNEGFINTSVIKSITKGRVNPPSVAILMAIDLIDKNGNRI